METVSEKTEEPLRKAESTDVPRDPQTPKPTNGIQHQIVSNEDPEEDENTENANKKTNDPDANTDTDAALSDPIKNTRMKGYLLITVVSIVNFNAADVVDGSKDLNITIYKPKNDKENMYARVVSIISLCICCIMTIISLFRFTKLQYIWKKMFHPKSKIELGILLFLVIWWCIATSLTTSVIGVAGSGKQRYNIYFSTWICLIASFWTLERWVVAAGFMTSLYNFLRDSPNRTPGWVALLMTAVLNLSFFIDFDNHWEEAFSQIDQNDYTMSVGKQISLVAASGQLEWMITLSTLTVLISLGFLLVEIFRHNSSSPSQQYEIEFKLEGVALFILVLCWIPTVIVVTSIGGIANYIGNLYFFTWLCTILVVHSFVMWTLAWRKMIWKVIENQDDEYHKAKQRTARENEEQERERDEDKAEEKEVNRESMDSNSLFGD